MSNIETLSCSSVDTDPAANLRCHVASQPIAKRISRPMAADQPASSFDHCDEVSATRLNAELRSSVYSSLRNVTCEVHEDLVILRGNVPSYYLKQLALAQARRVLGNGQSIENQVAVKHP